MSDEAAAVPCRRVNAVAIQIHSLAEELARPAPDGVTHAEEDHRC